MTSFYLSDKFRISGLQLATIMSHLDGMQSELVECGIYYECTRVKEIIESIIKEQRIED